MTTSPPTDTRSRFEAWADGHGLWYERGPAPYTNTEDRNGKYLDPVTETAWECWQAARSSGEPDGDLALAQEPKYTVAGGRIVNRATGAPIPDDEPVFIFRAKDSRAVGVLLRYARYCDNLEHRAAVERRIDDFQRFARERWVLMKEPDTAQPLTKDGDE